LVWSHFSVQPITQTEYYRLGEITVLTLSETDFDHIIYLAGCTLARKAGKNNWVEEDAVGGLPEYICRIARAVHESGKTISQSIAIAVGRVKTWSRGGGGVNADTRAKATKALAEWERAKANAKKNNKKTKLSADSEITLFFANSYNIDEVRKQYRDAHGGPNTYVYVREMWSDHMIVSEESDALTDNARIYKVDYSVDSDGAVSFGDRVEMKMAYVPLSHADLQTDLTDAQLELAAKIPCTRKDRGSLSNMVRLASENKNIELLQFAQDKPNLTALLSRS
jgi:hypothetical protein